MINNQETRLNQTQINTVLNDGSINEIKTNQRSNLSILFWLIIFTPIGLYLLWKERRLHNWFPNFLIFFGLINVITVAIMMLFVYPKLVKLYEEFGANFNKNNVKFIAVVILAVSAVEVVTGFFLKKKLKGEGFLKNASVFLCFGFFVFQYVPFGWLMRSFVIGTIWPIYNSISSIQNSPNLESTKQLTTNRIHSSEVTVEGCMVKVNTTKGDIYLNTNYSEFYPQTKCYQFVLSKVSPSGKYVVFQDISGGIDSMLKVYSIEHNDTIQLDVFGTSNIFDLLFLQDDKLISLYGYRGNYKEQFLKIFDLPGMFTDYPSNVDKQFKYFTNLAQFSTSITLPDMGEDYLNLSVSNGMLKLSATHGVFKEYSFDELLKK